MPEKATRRSRKVMITLLAAAAAVSVATLSGCGNDSTTTARCVDQNGNVLPDSACGSGTYVGGSGGGGYVGGSSGGTGGHGAAITRPRWVYGGGGGSAVGSRATGFSTSPPSEGGISSPSGTVVRGGFGGEGAAHGGGGEGGGHGGGGGE